MLCALLAAAGGGPETMVVLMEGEALLNDASAVTMFAASGCSYGAAKVVALLLAGCCSLPLTAAVPGSSRPLKAPAAAAATGWVQVFMGILEEHQGPGAAMPSVPSQIPTIITQILK